jgi:hypothetical protein
MRLEWVSRLWPTISNLNDIFQFQSAIKASQREEPLQVLDYNTELMLLNINHQLWLMHTFALMCSKEFDIQACSERPYVGCQITAVAVWHSKVPFSGSFISGGFKRG